MVSPTRLGGLGALSSSNSEILSPPASLKSTKVTKQMILYTSIAHAIQIQTFLRGLRLLRGDDYLSFRKDKVR